MRVLVFGASGGTGRQLITQGLEQGHQLTAFVRNPAAVTIKNENLTVVQGDVLNQEDVDRGVKGQAVVISVLGNKTSDALWKPNTIISQGVKHILAAMKKHRVRRLLFVASFGVNENIFWPEKIVLRTLLKNLFADIPRQETSIRDSGLDWTLIHPARLVDSPRTGTYKSGENLPLGLFSNISRADVADFLLKSIDNSQLIGKTVTLSY